MITETQITKYTGAIPTVSAVTKWFNEYAPKYNVDTPLRIAAFLAQTIHESCGFKYTTEIASGKAYEGRKDLGNIHPGDGIKFKGRGYLQITGRSNYIALSKHLFFEEKGLLNNPEILSDPQYAMLSALWFWDKKKLNKYADMSVGQKITTKKHGLVTPFQYITLLINGGFNGLKERIHIYNVICKDFGLPGYEIKKS